MKIWLWSFVSKFICWHVAKSFGLFKGTRRDQEKGSSEGKPWEFVRKKMWTEVFFILFASPLVFNTLDVVISSKKNWYVQKCTELEPFPTQTFFLAHTRKKEKSRFATILIDTYFSLFGVEEMFCPLFAPIDEFVQIK